MAKKIQARSILDELIGEDTVASEPISTISRPTVTQDASAVLKRNSKMATISGSFVESNVVKEEYVKLDIAYDTSQEFVGVDIFKSVNVSGSFERRVSLSLDQLSGSVLYKDYEIGEEDTYHYYSIFFDFQARLSDRTSVISVGKSFDVHEDEELLTLINQKIDPGSGVAFLTFQYNKPQGRRLIAKRLELVGVLGDVVGFTNDIAQPVEVEDLAVDFNNLKGRIFDEQGMVITQNGEELIDIAPILWTFGGKDFGQAMFLPELDNNRIIITFDYDKLAEEIDYVIILRRNLTSGQKQFNMPDPNWKTGTFLVPIDKEGSIKFVDFNVFQYDIYEYKVIGYDDAGNIVGILYKRVKLVNLPKEKEE